MECGNRHVMLNPVMYIHQLRTYHFGTLHIHLRINLANHLEFVTYYSAAKMK